MYRVNIEPVGETVEVREDQTILDACLRAGIWLPHACGHGLCGTCKVSVLEGEVDHGSSSSFALMDFERDEGRTLACSARPLSNLVIEADIDEEPDAIRHPVGDFIGAVERIEDPTPDIRVLWLRVEGEGIGFQAGQYINLDVPGVEGARAFSIASPPRERNLIELHVRLVPDGLATTWLHQELKPGVRLAFSGPYGRFFARRSADLPMIFLAGGSGLSAPKSIILDLLDTGFAQPITLIHGVRRPHDQYFGDLFRSLEQRQSTFRYMPVMSELQAEDQWTGEIGFVHQAAERLFDGRFAGHQAYLCGPPAMIEACITTLMHGRLFGRYIFTEQFVTAADPGIPARSPLFKRL